MSCNKNENRVQKGYFGSPNLKVKNGIMSPEVLLSFGRLSDPQLSPSQKTILYEVNYASIKEDKFCQNLYLSDVDGKNARQLSFDAKSISNARWAKDGKHIFYIQGGQIYKAEIKDLNSKKPYLADIQKLSNVKNSVREFKLSPDQSKLIYVSTVKGEVQTATDINPKLKKAKAYIVHDLMYRHWNHWTDKIPHSYVASLSSVITDSNSIDILGGPQYKYELPIEPFSGIEQLCWSPDGKYIAYSCKKLTGKQYAFSTNTEIYIFNVQTRKTNIIKMGGGYDTDPHWSPDGSKIAWLSMKRDGYESDKSRLMIADMKDGEASNIREMTSNFAYNAAAPFWSKDSKTVYFNALCQGLQALFACDVAEAKIERLTSDKLWYDFDSPFAILKNGDLLATYCSMDMPYEMLNLNPKTGQVRQISHINKGLLDQLLPHKTELKYIKTIDGKEMLTWVLYPPKFDSTKIYPAIEILLGGPQGTLSQSWSYRWNYRLMCSQGYIVILPNRRGTTAFGPKWTEEISGDYTGLNMQDYLSAARYFKKKPYVGKLAACGASYGGYSVYYLAGIHGNTYDCFIAHAGIFDMKHMYMETEEMWFPNWDNGGLSEYKYTPGQMGPGKDGKTFGGIQQAGSPWSNSPKAIRTYKNSPSVNVEKWHTPILCIHGELDYRIPYDQGMSAFNAAQMMGVPSKLVIFPEECHFIQKPQDCILWQECYFDWLNKWCKIPTEKMEAERLHNDRKK